MNIIFENNDIVILLPPFDPTATATYGYSTGTWGDMLTSYNGNSITYDAIGNPLSYYNGTR